MTEILLSNLKKMELHDRIKFFRLSKNLTQTYVAEQLDIDTGNYSRLERGETKISIERLIKITEIMEIDINLLLGKSLVPDEKCQETTEVLNDILIEIRKIYDKL